MAKLLYCIILVILLLFSVLYLPEFSYLLLLAALILPAVLLITGFYAARRCQFRILTDRNVCRCGDELSVPVEAVNASWIPIGLVQIRIRIECLTLEEETQVTAYVTLPMRGSAVARFPLTLRHCGAYRVTLERIRLCDVLRLFYHRKKSDSTGQFLVLPPLPPLPERLTPKRRPGYDEVPMRPTSDPEEFLGIRGFRAGDRMRSVHWKLSSRFPELLVKEYGEPVPLPIQAGLLYAASEGQQNGMGRSTRADLMIEALQTMALIALRAEQPFSLVFAHERGCSVHVLREEKELTPLLAKLLTEPLGTSAEKCQTRYEAGGYHAGYMIAASYHAPPPALCLLLTEGSRRQPMSYMLYPQAVVPILLEAMEIEKPAGTGGGADAK